MGQKLIKQIISIFVIAFLFIGNASFAKENPADHLIADSAFTIEQALRGLSPSCPQEIKNNQVLVDVVYYTTNGLIHAGQIIVDRRLADDVAQVFAVAFDNKFPFTSVIPINAFDWSDADSMAENNTSGFNYRQVTGGKKLSNHSFGFAIDINPLLNPYIKEEVTLPVEAVYDPSEPGTLTADHVIVKTFLSLGWEWGGNWKSLKDFQHFEKVP